ncbi:MAG: twin-arginine translocation signal domain-containing protein [Terriglobales bacterium]|jgi:hypothetical protein
MKQPPDRKEQDAKPLDRRGFLKTTGLLTGMVAAGGSLALIAPAHAWAIDLSAFSSAEGATILMMARTIAPHDKLDDAAYALVISALDSDATRDDKLRRLMKAGIASLGADFAKRDEKVRVATLKKIESSEFFRTVRLKTLQVLYATPMAYSYFGYEGEAFSKGGYLLRGFNDLRWLPDVPLEDSGPAPL